MAFTYLDLTISILIILQLIKKPHRILIYFNIEKTKIKIKILGSGNTYITEI